MTSSRGETAAAGAFGSSLAPRLSEQEDMVERLARRPEQAAQAAATSSGGATSASASQGKWMGEPGEEARGTGEALDPSEAYGRAPRRRREPAGTAVNELAGTAWRRTG